MMSKWPIRLKLLLGLALLVLVVAILSSTGLAATHLYRNLVNSLRWRAEELPLAAKLNQHVGDMRIALGELRGLRNNTFPGPQLDLVPVRVWAVRDQFRVQLQGVEQTLVQYRGQLDDQRQADPWMSDHQREWETVNQIESQLAVIRQMNHTEDWMLNLDKIGWFDAELERLQEMTTALPGHLHKRLAGLSSAVQGLYRTLILSAWTATASACLLCLVFVRLGYRWIFHPLRTLVAGSRRVASGDFDFRVRLDTDDEMAELAKALNDMTARFQEIRDDLDRQVRERTKQVVRSEQLASVGFLAAGVAHEINNPLASIAICAESLEGRLREGLDPTDPRLAVVGDYLRMIQTEAFRCKGITEKLLDFSRIGPSSRQTADFAELVRDVVEMLHHLGKYQRKHVELSPCDPLLVDVNPQEIKQVILNLLTNALDSLDDGGTVRVQMEPGDGFAVLTVSDDGCGMTPDVLERIFEPFFTRRRGGQGIGLGLSITYRIVADHGGQIEARSPGAGQGSTFRVRLPSAGRNVARSPSTVKNGARPPSAVHGHSITAEGGCSPTQTAEGGCSPSGGLHKEKDHRSQAA